MDDKLPTTKDPLGGPLEFIEYKTRERIVTVLQRQIVIRNEENKKGTLGVRGCSFIDVLNAMFACGIPSLVNGEQRFSQGVLNTWVDSLFFFNNPATPEIYTLSLHDALPI